MITLELQDEAQRSNTPDEKQIQQWINVVHAHLKTIHPIPDSELCIRIVTKEESARLNETFRHKKGPTNVLSFHYDESDLTLGDLACCAEVIENEAGEQHKSLNAHWAHMIVHGLLHLLGYNHEKEEEASIMEKIEIDILAKLNLNNPYQ